MTHNRALSLLPIANPSETLALHTTRLTSEQLEYLSRCAKGISLRFEKLEIVNTLVIGGYAEQGVAGVVTVTVKGQQYLRTHLKILVPSQGGPTNYPDRRRSGPHGD